METEGYLEQGKRYIESWDGVQASEKLYQAAEEAVKALSQAYAYGVWEEVREKGGPAAAGPPCLKGGKC